MRNIAAALILAFLGWQVVAPEAAHAQCASGYTQLTNTYACQPTTFTFGQTTVLGTGGTGSTIYAMSVTPSTTGTLQSLAINLTGSSPGMYLGLYDSDGTGGIPRTLLASTAAFDGVSGWNTVNVITPAAVSSGHVYYLAVTNHTNGVIVNGGTCCTIYYQASTTLTNPFVSGGSFTDGISEYGNGSVP